MMIRTALQCGAILGMLLGSGVVSYADDPTGLLLQQRGQLPRSHGPLPRFSDNGPCQRGMQQEAFPNHQGYRCVRRR